MKPLPSVDRLNQLFFYDPINGKLYWRKRNRDEFKTKRGYNIFNATWCGKEAGTIFTNQGGKSYYIVTIFYNRLYAHRIVFKILTGNEPDQIDHVNGNGLDNRPFNLRASNSKDNKKNLRISISNKSGVCGVDWKSSRKKWRARIQIDKKQIQLGSFVNFEDAVKVRKQAEIDYNFHLEHGSNRPL